MNYPQEQRINSAMDSQVKRLLAKAVDHEQMKQLLTEVLRQLLVNNEVADNYTPLTVDYCEWVLECVEKHNKLTGVKLTAGLEERIVNEFNK